MKKKFLTFLFAICFMLPCAFIMTGCGGNPPPEEPTLEGYTIFIKDEETSTFECVLGEKAIRPGDVVVVSKWSDETKNAIVPFNDFELSVSWYDWINGEEKTTFPDFWTNSTGYTNNDQVTNYWFKLTKDGVDVTFNVNIKQATKTTPQVKINNGSYSVTTAEVEWAHNDRNQDNPTNCYSLEMSGLTEEDGYNENFESFYVVEKEEYDALTTIQEKKEFLDNVKNSVGACGKNLVFTDYCEPGTYYIFAYVYQTNNYNYGEYGDGWIYNYATLTITEAEIEQTQQSNVINYDKDWDFNIYFDWLDFPSELPDIRYYVSGHIEQYEYIDGTWTVSDDYADTLKVPAIKSGDYYELVDLKNWQSSMEEWTVLNHNGTPAYDVDDNSKIEMVEYTKLRNYFYYDSITLPIYYKVAEVEYLHYDYSKLFKTEVTINKYKLDYLPSVTPTAENAEYGVIGENEFEFTYRGFDFSSDIECAYYNFEYGNYFEIQGHDEEEYIDGWHYGQIVLTNPNIAWEWSENEFSSRPIPFSYRINKESIPYPVYSTGGTDYTDYFNNYIEVEWKEINQYLTGYRIDEYIEFSYDYVNIYRYIMKDGDELITDKAVMAEKIREHGEIVNDYENINDPENNVPGKVIIMYELENNNVTWEDEKTEPVFFKFEIVKADQNPRIESEYGGTISSNEQVWIEISSSGTADLETHILENTEYYGNYSNATDAPLVFELVDKIPDIAATTGVGTLENGVITVDGNAETSPLGTFCIKVTKAGNDCYNDFEMYVQVIISGYSCDNVLSQYINSLSELDNYVTLDDGYEYEGLVFESGTTFAELNLPELPTTEYGKFEWFITINSDNVKLTDGTVLGNASHVRIMFTANDGKKWFIDDSYDSTIDGVSYTGYGLRIYMEQIN